MCLKLWTGTFIRPERERSYIQLPLSFTPMSTTLKRVAPALRIVHEYWHQVEPTGKRSPISFVPAQIS